MDAGAGGVGKPISRSDPILKPMGVEASPKGHEVVSGIRDAVGTSQMERVTRNRLDDDNLREEGGVKGGTGDALHRIQGGKPGIDIISIGWGHEHEACQSKHREHQ